MTYASTQYWNGYKAQQSDWKLTDNPNPYSEHPRSAYAYWESGWIQAKTEQARKDQAETTK